MVYAEINATVEQSKLRDYITKYGVGMKLKITRTGKVKLQYLKYMDDGYGNYGDADVRLYGKLEDADGTKIHFNFVQVIQRDVPIQAKVSIMDFWQSEAEGRIANANMAERKCECQFCNERKMADKAWENLSDKCQQCDYVSTCDKKSCKKDQNIKDTIESIHEDDQ